MAYRVSLRNRLRGAGLSAIGTQWPQRNHLRIARVNHNGANPIYDPLDGLALSHHDAIPVDSHHPSRPTSTRIGIRYDLVASTGRIDDPTNDVAWPHTGSSYEEPSFSIVTQATIRERNRRPLDAFAPASACFLQLRRDFDLHCPIVQTVRPKTFMEHVSNVIETDDVRI